MNNIDKLYFEIVKLNPDIQFSRDRIERRVISSASMDKVKLPEGFYYENGVVTNGAENFEDRISMSIEVRLNNSHLQDKLYFEMVKLNPDIQFSRDRIERRVISSASMDKVKLPEGFYYENGMVTNGAENFEDRISISIVSPYQNQFSEEDESKKNNFLKERSRQRQQDNIERDKQLKNRLNFISKLISNFSNNQSNGGKAK